MQSVPNIRYLDEAVTPPAPHDTIVRWSVRFLVDKKQAPEMVGLFLGRCCTLPGGMSAVHCQDGCKEGWHFCSTVNAQSQEHGVYEM